MVNTGIVRESVYPYLDKDWECDLTAPSEFYLSKAWLYLRDDTETTEERRQKIKHIMMTYGPVDAVLHVHEDFYSGYTSGIYMYDGTSAALFYHGVVLVGWVDDNSIPSGGYWIAKNEWGETWGENGYFRIAYDSQDINLIEFDIRYGLYAGIGNDPPYFEGMEDQYQSREGRELTISHYAVDPDGDAIYYSGQGLPRGMSIDPATGVISWIPDFTQAGDYNITLTVADGEYSFHREVSINIINVKKIKKLS